jgi:GTP cyclohydrolase IB
MTTIKLPLEDVQAYPDHRGIALQMVGVSQVQMPLVILQKDGLKQHVAAKIRLSVDLAKEEKGTHLSRFIIQLNESSKNNDVLSIKLESFLQETRQRLGSQAAQIKMEFPFFYDKKSPVSDFFAKMAYNCAFEAKLLPTDQTQIFMSLEAPIATLCPCSKQISDYGAHNQRALIRVKLFLASQTEQQMVWIEDVIEALDQAASCPVYPILKRADEKYVTEKAYDTPKFVEDVIRDVIGILRDQKGVDGFEVEVEALESIHAHNAWAYHTESMPVV